MFAFVAAVTAYWAAMGRMLGFMLFPREGAAGGAWSFLLSPVSAAVADLPLALFVFRSPLALASLLLPMTACIALTILCGGYLRPRALDGDRARVERAAAGAWLPVAAIRRNAVAVVAGLVIAVASAGVAGRGHAPARTGTPGRTSRPLTTGCTERTRPRRRGCRPDPGRSSTSTGITVAAAGLAGIVASAGADAGHGDSQLLRVLLARPSGAAWFDGGGRRLWGMQAGFGGAAPLEPWLAGAGGIALVALALNTGAALPIYWSLVFGSGRRLGPAPRGLVGLLGARSRPGHSRLRFVRHGRVPAAGLRLNREREAGLGRIGPA